MLLRLANLKMNWSNRDPSKDDSLHSIRLGTIAYSPIGSHSHTVRVQPTTGGSRLNINPNPDDVWRQAEPGLSRGCGLSIPGHSHQSRQPDW
jgi:hypothetical protein